MEQRKLQEMKNDLSSEGFVRNPQRKQLIERWNKWIPQKDAFGRPVRMDGYRQYCLAQLYENQLSEIKNFREKHVLGEDSSTVNTAPFIKYTFPLLRRVWPALIAPEIVSVQPMSAPVGAVFYFELKYGTNKGLVQAGQKLVKDFNRNYSSEKIDGETYLTTAGPGTALGGTLVFKPVRPGTVNITIAGVSGSITDNGANVLTGTAGCVLASPGNIDYSTGIITATLATGAGAGKAVVAIYEYNMEGNSQVPSIDIDIALVAVVARTRKLKSLWSSEAADDLKAIHGVDAEQELVSGVGSELALEIDREIIEDIRAGQTGASTSFDMSVPTGVTHIDHYSRLMVPLALISNQIGKNTLRGPANFIVMSYDAAAAIESLGTHGFFRPIFAGNKDAMAPAEEPQTWGVMKMGTLQQRWTCYKDPYLKSDEMVMGYKGNSFVDAGYVWAPYVPLQVTNTFLDPNDFKYRKGLRTRYAKLLARPEFYGKLTLGNLTTLSAGTFGPDHIANPKQYAFGM